MQIFEDNYALSSFQRALKKQHGGLTWRKIVRSVGNLTEWQDDATFEPARQDIDAFARCIFPMVKTYFESKEGRREFAAWKRKKELERISENDKS